MWSVLCPLCMQCPLPCVCVIFCALYILSQDHVAPLDPSTPLTRSDLPLSASQNFPLGLAPMLNSLSVDASILPQRGACDESPGSGWFIALTRCGFQAAREPGSFPSHARFCHERAQMCVIYLGVWGKSSFQTLDSTSERWRRYWLSQSVKQAKV